MSFELYVIRTILLNLFRGKDAPAIPFDKTLHDFLDLVGDDRRPEVKALTQEEMEAARETAAALSKAKWMAPGMQVVRRPPGDDKPPEIEDNG